MKLIRAVFCLLLIVLFFSLLHIPASLTTSNERTINVFAWGDYFSDPSLIKDFENRTGIRVRVHTYETNEEMYVKFLANQTGYDIIIPSDYATKMLIEKNLLKKLDHSKLNFLHKIYPSLLGHSYDPHNDYSIPNTWETSAIVVDTESLKLNNTSLGVFFDPSLIRYKFCMTPDPIEAITFASYYLYGNTEDLTPDKASEVEALLLSQKPHIEAYADCRAKYLIQTKNCPIAFERSSFIWQISKENPSMQLLDFEEATFISIENLVIPKESKKEDLVYAFINYLYEPKAHAKLIGLAPMYPANPEALDYLSEPSTYHDHFYKSANSKNLVFFRRLLTEEETRNIWINLKS